MTVQDVVFRTYFFMSFSFVGCHFLLSFVTRWVKKPNKYLLVLRQAMQVITNLMFGEDRTNLNRKDFRYT
jgi:hypothetical protein